MSIRKDNGGEHREKWDSPLLSSREWWGEVNKRQSWFFTAWQQRTGQMWVNRASTGEDNGCEHWAEHCSPLLSSREWERERNKRKRWFFTLSQKSVPRNPAKFCWIHPHLLTSLSVPHLGEQKLYFHNNSLHHPLVHSRVCQVQDQKCHSIGHSHEWSLVLQSSLLKALVPASSDPLQLSPLPPPPPLATHPNVHLIQCISYSSLLLLSFSHKINQLKGLGKISVSLWVGSSKRLYACHWHKTTLNIPFSWSGDMVGIVVCFILILVCCFLTHYSLWRYKWIGDNKSHFIGMCCMLLTYILLQTTIELWTLWNM